MPAWTAALLVGAGLAVIATAILATSSKKFALLYPGDRTERKTAWAKPHMK